MQDSETLHIAEIPYDSGEIQPAEYRNGEEIA
jgi:hypothetical protein